MVENRKEKRKIIYSIDSNFECAVLAAMSARGLCAMTRLAPDEVNRVELSVVEIVNNAIEHAYQGKSGNKVEIEIDYCSDEYLEITVSDWGLSMNLSAESVRKKPVEPDPNNESWLVSGRGLNIVRQLMDDMAYKSQDGKNSFVMRKKIV